MIANDRRGGGAGGESFRRGARGRQGSRRLGLGRRRGEGDGSQRGEGEALLLFEKGLEGSLILFLAVEELPVKLGGLLPEVLQRDEVFLRGSQRLGEQAGVGRVDRDHRGSKHRARLAVGLAVAEVVRGLALRGPALRAVTVTEALAIAIAGGNRDGGMRYGIRCHGRACNRGRCRGLDRDGGRRGDRLGFGSDLRGLERRFRARVRAANLDGHSGLARRGGSGADSFVPAFKSNRIADRGEFGQCAGEVGEIPLRPLRDIHRQGAAGTFGGFQDRPYQARQFRVGTDFHERRHPRPRQRLDFLRELNGPRELFGEHRAGEIGVAGIKARRGVRVNRPGRRVEVHLPKRFEEWSACLGDVGAMESGRHREAAAGHLARRERGFRLLDRRHRPGQHELFRGVSVGDDQIDRLGAKHVLDGLDRGQNGEHRASAGFGFLGHQAATFSGEVEQSGVVDPTRGAERGQFAEAMPGEGVGLDAEVF